MSHDKMLSKRACKYPNCIYYNPNAVAYCCNACSCDHHDTLRLEKEKCILCEMGVPRRVMVQAFNNGVSIQWKMTEDQYNKIFGEKCPVCHRKKETKP